MIVSWRNVGIAMGLRWGYSWRCLIRQAATHNMVASWLIFLSPVNDKHALAETKTKQNKNMNSTIQVKKKPYILLKRLKDGKSGII